MKPKPNDTIERVCPIFRQLDMSEKLSIWYDFALLLNDYDYELTELIFETIMVTVFSVLDLYTYNKTNKKESAE